jgi:hypothetical protein
MLGRDLLGAAMPLQLGKSVRFRAEEIDVATFSAPRCHCNLDLHSADVGV